MGSSIIASIHTRCTQIELNIQLLVILLPQIVQLNNLPLIQAFQYRLVSFWNILVNALLEILLNIFPSTVMPLQKLVLNLQIICIRIIQPSLQSNFKFSNLVYIWWHTWYRSINNRKQNRKPIVLILSFLAGYEFKHVWRFVCLL